MCVGRSHFCVVTEDRRSVGGHLEFGRRGSSATADGAQSMIEPDDAGGRKLRGVRRDRAGATSVRPVGCDKKATKKGAAAGRFDSGLCSVEKVEFRPTKHSFPDSSRRRADGGGLNRTVPQTAGRLSTHEEFQ